MPKLVLAYCRGPTVSRSTIVFGEFRIVAYRIQGTTMDRSRERKAKHEDGNGRVLAGEGKWFTVGINQ